LPSGRSGLHRLGQSGDLASVYAHHGLDADTVVAAGARPAV